MTAQTIYYVPQEWQLRMYLNPSKYIQEMLDDEEWYNMVMFELFEPYHCDDYRAPQYGTEEFRQLMFEKYGVYHNRHIPSVNETCEKTRKETMLKKYGVVSPAQIPEIMKKVLESRNKSMIEKYGVADCMKVTEIKERQRASLKKTLEQEGVENVFQRDSVKSQIKSTNLEKYGVENIMQLPEQRKRASEKAKVDIQKKKNRKIVKTLYKYVSTYKVKLGKSWYRKKDEELYIILEKLESEYGTL